MNLTASDKRRFFKKIRWAGGKDECWLWRARKRLGDDYGEFHLHGETARAHRVAYEIWNGPIPDGLFVMHKCDTPACVNPDHLVLGTNADNMADAVRKGRLDNRGERNGQANLSEFAVILIREMDKLRPKPSQAVIARFFGVSQKQVSRIVLRQRWKHIK